ncbi:DNA repair protein RadA [Solemya velum gill symbiont]|uniref:DNA repair protein RadA n=3 Tax=Solemya velum gill symbiont TaxID=2340 RepID=A0A1T2K1A7_SOVGS|nr:DNA repair protein RadA [Solemya velum gill symbiont]OOY35048.1 DNA repair protein RadA [Solemya velum gill symbiont]OOY37750.1 DNA repair protein RadA [Solemya velum gill symbiont]OOY40588.1 DNA repair protein RadA [Solemya velum gill symbiont]OOY45309.1 DNA repair protein RadA [Solemya velum gill symbiont]OOY48354.1 DNA repair protein RadA [Solemya velum gill symbiont]
MAKAAKVQYQCDQCGATYPKWAGQCSDCGAWNSLSEARVAPPSKRPVGYAGESGDVTVRKLSEVGAETQSRINTGISELNRVLGTGLVEGSVVLLGGDPGIGKSTLLIQMLAMLAASHPALYVSGEESAEQIGLRARRLGLDAGDLGLLTETSIERVLALASSAKPRIMVVDSIQTMYTEMIQSAPGGVAQVRESTAQLVRFAKQTGTCVILVGHVTKEGNLAGPRVLEHMVDTVLYFEGEAGSQFRLIRTMKNRFGAVNELGLFAMTDQGLKPVTNPSAIFLSRHEEPVSGSAILVTREGSRPLLVEVQALVDSSPLSNPRRVSLGLEQNRLSMLLAVLHRHAGVGMYDQDVYVNVVGGVRITETAADLPVLLSVLSSFRDRPLSRHLAAFGEVGLSGEIRPVPNGEERIREAVKHGFTRILVPSANKPKSSFDGVEIVPVQRLSEAISHTE